MIKIFLIKRLRKCSEYLTLFDEWWLTIYVKFKWSSIHLKSIFSKSKPLCRQLLSEHAGRVKAPNVNENQVLIKYLFKRFCTLPSRLPEMLSASISPKCSCLNTGWIKRHESTRAEYFWSWVKAFYLLYFFIQIIGKHVVNPFFMMMFMLVSFK